MKIAVHIDFGELPMGPHATPLATEHYLHMWKEAEYALMCGRSGQNTSYRSLRHPQSCTGKESWSLLLAEDHQSLRWKAHRLDGGKAEVFQWPTMQP